MSVVVLIRAASFEDILRAKERADHPRSQKPCPICALCVVRTMLTVLTVLTVQP